MTEKKLTDVRLLNWLEKRGIKTQEQLRDFLNPSFSMLNNPLGLKGVKEATNIIKQGLNENKRFAIVGDYDCDGIMASTVIYQYLKSQNAAVDVFIPNRFDDGYGLNMNLACEIASNYHPDILITVDLGISCEKEVAYLKSRGVNVIVTDHHEPPEVVPDCVIIDPKIPQDYACPFLCGTGVAYKLVSALGGFEFANNFLDIVAIATIGDIVPLLGENRVIASIGLDKLNGKYYSLASIKYLIEELKLEKLSSTDIYLKLVPKINASGRMDNGKKVFDFINTTDKGLRQRLLAEIFADNALRLEQINKAVAEIETELNKIDVLNTPILCIKGDFHQGILGILASRVVADFGRPAIVFAATENGTLKASGRSVDGVDLHSIVTKTGDLCLHFGGHKMALGLEILPENFENFKARLNNAYTEQNSNSDSDYCKKIDAIDITESDINSGFIEQVNMLSPFGCNNEKPLFRLSFDGEVKTESLSAKSDAHLKLKLKSSVKVVYFFGGEHKFELEAPVKKEVYVDLDFNYFKNKETPQGVVKKIQLIKPKFFNNKVEEKCVHAIMKARSILDKRQNLGKSLSLDELIKSNLFDKTYGTLVFGFDDVDLKKLQAQQRFNGFEIDMQPQKNLRNTIICDYKSLSDSKKLFGYKNLVFMSEKIAGEFDHFIADGFNVFVGEKRHIDLKFGDLRAKCGLVYSIISKKLSNVSFNSFIEYCFEVNKLAPNIEPYQVAVITLGLGELGLVETDESDLTSVLVKNETQNEKKCLEESEILEWFKK